MKLARLIKKCLNETYSRVHTGKYSSDKFPIQNGLKQNAVISFMLFNTALDSVIMKVQVGQK
jgi:hypothetical protein